MIKTPTPTDTLTILRGRDGCKGPYCYKLSSQGSYGMDIMSDNGMVVDEKRMSVLIPFADGTHRDGVGDLLEVEGINTKRHRKNPVILFDHGKSVVLPIGKSEDPETGEYTVRINPADRMAEGTAFFYQGTGKDEELTGERKSEHQLFCEQLFHLIARKFIRAGSIGYQVIKALPLQANYETGTPQGLHLLSTLLLEYSAVVMPANMDTVGGKRGKGYSLIAEALDLPLVCGKSLSPMLRKSFEVYSSGKRAQLGYEGKSQTPVPLKDVRNGPKVPPVKWKPGVGAVKSAPLTVDWIVKAQDKDGKTHTYTVRGKTAAEARQRAMERAKSEGKTLSNWKCEMSKGLKTLDNVRLKYRSGKGRVRRMKKSRPGSSVIYVNSKDLDRVREAANSKGVKATWMVSGKGVEKLKLTGDDGIIDDIAKSFARPLRHGMGRKSIGENMSKTVQTKTKEMPPDAAMPAGDPQEVLQDIEEGLEELEGTSPDEPYGAQIIRRIHDDISILMGEYDEMMGPLENEDVKSHLMKTLEEFEQKLTDNEELFGKHYSHLPNSLSGEKDLEDVEGVVEDELEAEQVEDSAKQEEVDVESEGVDAESDVEDKDMDTMNDDGVAADSETEEEPPVEDSVEGMDTKRLSFKQMKELRNHYKKNKGKKSLTKSMCKGCKKEKCSCGTKSVGKKKEKNFDKETEEQAIVNTDGDNPTEGMEKALDSREQSAVQEATGFLKELSTTGDFGEDHRMKSYHFHKTMDAIGGIEEAEEAVDNEEPQTKSQNPASNQPTKPYKAPKPESGGENPAPSPDASTSSTGGENTAGPNKSMPHRKICKETSSFFDGLSREKAFGDSHRQQATHYHAALDGILKELADKGPGADGETMEKINEETITHEPGEMGEKSITDLRKTLLEQNEEIENLMNTITRLTSRLN